MATKDIKFSYQADPADIKDLIEGLEGVIARLKKGEELTVLMAVRLPEEKGTRVKVVGDPGEIGQAVIGLLEGMSEATKGQFAAVKIGMVKQPLGPHNES